MKNYKIEDRFQIGPGHESIGMTSKYYKDGIWYKQNLRGTEGQSEEICSKLLSCSNITDYVQYGECLINGIPGCLSDNFLRPDENLITFQHLYELYHGGSLKNRINQYDKLSERVEFVLDFVYEKNKLDVRSYLNKMLYFDMLTLCITKKYLLN